MLVLEKPNGSELNGQKENSALRSEMPRMNKEKYFFLAAEGDETRLSFQKSRWSELNLDLNEKGESGFKKQVG